LIIFEIFILGFMMFVDNDQLMGGQPGVPPQTNLRF
jgi:hypothetical protein